MEGLPQNIRSCANSLDSAAARLATQANRLAGQSGLSIHTLRLGITNASVQTRRLSRDVGDIANFLTTVQSTTQRFEDAAFRAMNGEPPRLIDMIRVVGPHIGWASNIILGPGGSPIRRLTEGMAANTGGTTQTLWQRIMNNSILRPPIPKGPPWAAFTSWTSTKSWINMGFDVSGLLSNTTSIIPSNLKVLWTGTKHAIDGWRRHDSPFWAVTHGVANSAAALGVAAGSKALQKKAGYKAVPFAKKSALKGAIGGAKTGAKIGMFLGPKGAAAGAVIGGVIGAVGGTAIGVAAAGAVTWATSVATNAATTVVTAAVDGLSNAARNIRGRVSGWFRR